MTLYTVCTVYNRPIIKQHFYCTVLLLRTLFLMISLLTLYIILLLVVCFLAALKQMLTAVFYIASESQSTVFGYMNHVNKNDLDSFIQSFSRWWASLHSVINVIMLVFNIVFITSFYYFVLFCRGSSSYIIRAYYTINLLFRLFFRFSSSKCTDCSRK